MFQKFKRKALSMSLGTVVLGTIFASSASAANPPAGIYLGGEVQEYYAISEFIPLQGKATKLNKAGLANVKYVHTDGKITSASVLASGKKMSEALVTLNPGDLLASYKRVDGSILQLEQQNTAPMLSNVSLTSADGTVTAVVDNTANTITFEIPSTYTARFNTGTATLSDSVKVTLDAVDDKFDITTPVDVDKTADASALAQLILTTFGGSSQGVQVSTLLANSGSKLTLQAGNQTRTYTLIAKTTTQQ